MFTNRAVELNALEERRRAADRKSQLLVIYGRRRLGKTTLVKEFLKKNRGVYIFIEPKSDDLILRDCEIAFGKALGHPPRIDSWETLFNIALEEDLTLVLDEFQNLGAVSSHLYAKIQNIWDSIEDRPGLFLIVIGSYVGMINKIFRDERQPLFGRATGMMRIEPFDIFNTTKLLGNMDISIERCLCSYAVFGGVPRYLVELDNSDSNIERLFFGPTSFLKEEGKNLLVLEFGSVHRGYFSVLESISSGRVTPSQIADHTGLKPATVSKYLGELLEDYEMVMAEHPTTIGNRRYIRYRIRDNFFDFWFRNIHSRKSLIEIDPEAALEESLDRLPDIVSRKMENVIRQILIREKPLFAPTEIGRWWDRQGNEIDLVAIDDRTSQALFIEVKWTNRKTGWKTVQDLKEKSKLIQWKKQTRREHFLIVSKSDFTTGCIKRMESEGIMHWNISDIEKMILKES